MQTHAHTCHFLFHRWVSGLHSGGDGFMVKIVVVLHMLRVARKPQSLVTTVNTTLQYYKYIHQVRTLTP